jgi:integrase
MSALFTAIDTLPTFRDEPFLHQIAPALFRLTYTCGLRPNESRELLRENINFDTGEILITHTKCAKERIVVMSDDIAEQLNNKRS